MVAQANNGEDQLLGYFLAGQCQDIRSLVHPCDPNNLTQSMEVAHALEEAMNQMQNYGNMQGRAASSRFRYHGGSRIEPWREQLRII